MNKIKEEEIIQEEREVADWNKPDFRFIPKQTHDWHQEGYYLICRGCDLEHGVYIGEHKIMIGITDIGMPILKSRTDLKMA